MLALALKADIPPSTLSKIFHAKGTPAYPPLPRIAVRTGPATGQVMEDAELAVAKAITEHNPRRYLT
jgi:hypothetical protein